MSPHSSSPEGQPTYPFAEDDCPVCLLTAKLAAEPEHEPWPKGQPRPLP